MTLNDASNYALALADQNAQLRQALAAIVALKAKMPVMSTVIEMKRIAREALEK